ncbi:MAG: crosslink repair DNA glycosylase YcaQ family protein [Acidimicrobiia bacterium]
MLRVIRNMGTLQIDSVNVIARAHEFTLYSRLGAYDPGLVWRALEERRVFEYWAHMASFSPIEDVALLKHRMDRYAERSWEGIREIESKSPGYVEAVYQEVRERGPLTASDLDDPGERRGPWWGWADGKYALEYLFFTGRVSVAHRRNFTRFYDITERVIPAEHLDGPALDEEAAMRELLRRGARSVGVGTLKDLADYYRVLPTRAAPTLDALVKAGEIVEVEVEGWSDPAYLHPEATIPRAVSARSLLNPFDPIVWFRDRTERLYDFHYRIEIYTPAPNRVHGYYVCPFLLGDDLVARVDLKADRKAGALRVPGAFSEDGVDRTHVARELAAELREMARWLGLGEIEVGTKGDLAGELRKAV